MKQDLTIKSNRVGVQFTVSFTMDRQIRLKEPIELEVLRGWSEEDRDALKGRVDFCTLYLRSEVKDVAAAKKAKEELVSVKRLLKSLESEAMLLDDAVEVTLLSITE